MAGHTSNKTDILIETAKDARHSFSDGGRLPLRGKLRIFPLCHGHG
jgi:hypothetical protein